MWIQTVCGTFSIARLPGDSNTGMVHLLCNRYDELVILSCDYLLGQEPEPLERGPFSFGIRIPEAQAGALMAKLVSQVWYADLPQAVETLYGAEVSHAYRGADKTIRSLIPQLTDLRNPCWSGEKTILDAGIEGGSVSIAMRDEKGQRRYAVRVFDCTQCFLSEEDQIDPVIIKQGEEFSGWDEAIMHLSRHPWWHFSPAFVDPEYADLVKLELRSRGVDPINSVWSKVFPEHNKTCDY